MRAKHCIVMADYGLGESGCAGHFLVGIICLPGPDLGARFVPWESAAGKACGRF